MISSTFFFLVLVAVFAVWMMIPLDRWADWRGRYQSWMSRTKLGRALSSVWRLGKGSFSWLLVVVGCGGVAIDYYGVYLVATWKAVSVAWWIDLASFYSGPVAAVGVFVARRPPRQRAAEIVGVVAVTAWLLLFFLFVLAMQMSRGG